jgi:hypothetical protein
MRNILQGKKLFGNQKNHGVGTKGTPIDRRIDFSVSSQQVNIGIFNSKSIGRYI